MPKLQGHYSNSFMIHRGTRKHCPLSPIIFAIAIETLATAIRNHPDIHDVTCGSRVHKCALFADDLLLFITLPLISTPNIFKLLQDFGKVSGLRVNMAKSVALNITTPAHLPGTLIPYLGINLTASVDQLYNANYPTMYKKLKEDLSK